MKVFITGLGSDIGTQIARSLEQRKEITGICGVDMFPPRRYLGRTKFFMVHHDDSERITEIINNFSPDIIINFGVYEPGSRLTVIKAREATRANIAGIIHSLKTNNSVHVITRSSVVVYGFTDQHKIFDETSPVSPDTHYGEICRNVEEELRSYTNKLSIIRTAPEIGSHVPHPLARILTLPVILYEFRNPFSRDIGFPIISPYDTVEIFTRCVFNKNNDKFRIFHASTASNATTMMAIKEGRRIPLISIGVGFSLAKQLSYILGAPVDDHVELLLRRGLQIDSTSTRMHLGITSQDSATEIIRNLYRGEEKSIESTMPLEIGS